MSLDPGFRRFIHEWFDKKVEGTEVEDLPHLGRRLRRVVDSLLSREVAWQSDLARFAEAIFEVVFEQRSAGSLDVRVRRASYVALSYLCDPQDHIPDYAPGIGYLDDALVVNRCLAAIRRVDRNLFDEICVRAKPR